LVRRHARGVWETSDARRKHRFIYFLELPMVNVKLDRHALHTFRMGLDALRLNADAVELALESQVEEQQQLAAEKDQRQPAHTNAVPAKPTNGEASGRRAYERPA